MELATFGAGCFWCVEAVFQQLEGVESVMPGYMGGQMPNPTYKQVYTGTTGYAEVAQITFDADKISFAELLEIFWVTHDPTSLNRQGNDIGTHYRSVIFCHNEDQRTLAEQSKQKIDASDLYPNPIVTEIVAAQKFYPAEDYHHNYYNLNSQQPYCAVVISPKIAKFKKKFKHKLKKQ